MASESMVRIGTHRSKIRELFEYSKQLKAIHGEQNVYDFSIGNPTLPPPECVTHAIRQITLEGEDVQVHGYSAAQGDPATRAAISDHLNKRFCAGSSADDIYMTCGAASSLTISFMALTESTSDEFLVCAPYFPEYGIFLKSSGATMKIVRPRFPDLEIDFDHLRESITANTRGIIINSPNNPSGVIYSGQTIATLSEILREESLRIGHPIYIISDEPYREIAYDGAVVPYIPDFYPHTIICHSFSKSLSLPGERIGFIYVPRQCDPSGEIYAAVCGAARVLGYVCAPVMFQRVIASCIGQTADISLYRRNRDILYEALTAYGYECVRPQGAFYLMVKAPGGDSQKFCDIACSHNIIMVPTDDFGCPGYVRISYCMDDAMIRRSLPAFRSLAGSMTQTEVLQGSPA